jgi:hypothetical protein
MSTDDGRQTFVTAEGREIPRPRKRNAKLPDRYQALVDGQITVEDLDDEELFRGQLRGADGYIRGRHPKAIPWVMHDAFVQQVTQRLERTIVESMPDIVQGLIDIATGGINDDTGIAMDVRAKAQMYLMDRILGRPKERTQVDVNVQARWEQAFQGGDVVVDIPESDIIDAEPVPHTSLAELPQGGSILVELPPEDGGRADGAEPSPPAEEQPRPRPRKRTGVKLR